jgi:hypothetical protein
MQVTGSSFRNSFMRDVIDQVQLRGDFTFANAVRLHGGMNPDFFTGTVVEKQAAELLSVG